MKKMMKMKNQSMLSKMFREVRAGLNRRKFTVIFLISVMLILSLGMIKDTLGAFVHSFILNDSANTTKFDVTVIAPEEFNSEQDTNHLDYHFLSDTDIRGFVFQVQNNGETDVVCTPYIDGAVLYRIYVEGVEQTEFIVRKKETESFYLVIAPTGLDTDVIEANFYVEVRQTEGR